MTELEERIIKKLSEPVEARGEGWEEEVNLLFQELLNTPPGSLTPEFLNNQTFKEQMKKHEGASYHEGAGLNYNFKTSRDFTLGPDPIFLRIKIETYLVEKDEKAKRELYLEIENFVRKVNAFIYQPHGQGLLPSIISREVIRAVYLSKDKSLTALFSVNLPIPGVELFAGYPLPPFIENRIKEANEAVLKFLDKRALPDVEPAVLKAQRAFRGRRRRREEIARIAEHPHISRSAYLQGREMEKKNIAEQALQEANTPYTPQRCSRELAARIVKAAGKVKLFNTVHHLTSEAALTNICNESLLGRRTLLQRYLPFKPAALDESDLLLGGGDANVICFGPAGIDPKAIQEDAVDIVFDVNALRNNPCIFYKQQDLGYDPETIRTLTIGQQKLNFSHTSTQIRHQSRGLTYLKIHSNDGPLFYYSPLPNYHVISYNLDKMHQILALNFFKHLDTLKNVNADDSIEFIRKIYSEIEKLDDKGLVEFLTKLGQQMTDTAEFNFYGAYRIDFSAIKSISLPKKISVDAPDPYSLNLERFIKALEDGNKEELTKAKQNIPHLFKSYRFLDYLISKIKNEAMIGELQSLRDACSVPVIFTPQKPSEKPDRKALEGQLLSELRKLKALQGKGDMKEKMDSAISRIEAIQKEANLVLEDLMSTEKTLKEELEAATSSMSPVYKERLFEVFAKSDSNMKPD